MPAIIDVFKTDDGLIILPYLFGKEELLRGIPTLREISYINYEITDYEWAAEKGGFVKQENCYFADKEDIEIVLVALKLLATQPLKIENEVYKIDLIGLKGVAQ